MITKEVKKIYKGCIDIRDYIVQRCIQENKYIKIVHGDKQMVLSPLQLKNEVVRRSEPFKSNYNNLESYRLFSYIWKPETIKEEEEKVENITNIIL